MITIEQGEEAGLGTSGALHAAESEIISCPLDVTEIPQQLLRTSRVPISNPYMPHITNKTYLKPECGALPNRRQLRGLEVGETEGRQVAILVR